MPERPSAHRPRSLRRFDQNAKIAKTIAKGAKASLLRVGHALFGVDGYPIRNTDEDGGPDRLRLLGVLVAFGERLQ